MDKTLENLNFPPGPVFRFPIALYFKLRSNPLGFMGKMAREYGDLVHYKLGPRHDYLINDPAHIQEVLLAGEEAMGRSTPPPLKRVLGNGLLISQGDFHRRQRRLLQPSFHRQKVMEMIPVMTETSEFSIRDWKPGEVRDLSEEMKHLTMRVVIKTILGSKVSRSEELELSESIDVMQEMMNKNELPFIDVLLERLPLPHNLRFRKSLKRLNEMISNFIEQKRASGNYNQPDFLSMLLELSQTPEGSETLSNQQILDETKTLFVAGHETTSHALTWTWYLLSQHPKIEAKMHTELAQVLQGRLPSGEDLGKLNYTRKVFSEAMRLYPPVWVVGRRPVKDFKLGDYTIPAGAHLYMSQFLVHRDARYYPDPERFDPERWNPEAVAARPRYSYFPFGGGSRLCIGEGFAWTEGMIVLAILAQRWQFKLAPGHVVEPETCITLRPKYGMKMVLVPRNQTKEKLWPVNSSAKSA